MPSLSPPGSQMAHQSPASSVQWRSDKHFFSAPCGLSQPRRSQCACHSGLGGKRGAVTCRSDFLSQDEAFERRDSQIPTGGHIVSLEVLCTPDLLALDPAVLLQQAGDLLRRETEAPEMLLNDVVLVEPLCP